MQNEKMKILNLLQEGSITADEAAKLLAAIEGTAGTEEHPPRSASEPIPNSNDRSGATSSSTVQGVDFDKLKHKFSTFAKDLEPKLQKATEIAAKTTVNLADKISKTIETSLESGSLSQLSGRTPRTTPPPRPARPHRPATAAAAPANGVVQNIELLVQDGFNELNLSGLNAHVNVKGYNGDKITAQINFKAKNRAAKAPELMKLGGKYFLNYEEEDFDFVDIDAYIPSHKFEIVNISALNGNMDISAINSGQVQLSNSNGQTSLTNITANQIKSESGNGSLTVANLEASALILEHCNGNVNVLELDVEKVSLVNFNGPVLLSNSKFNAFSEYLWNVETSNAKLTLNIPTLPNLGYHVQASSALGEVRLGITNLEFLTNDPGRVEARTAAFDTQPKKVRLSLETSNFPLTVN
ncbi:MAG: DUF4097 domain-containing protein [Turicibacter sp.]|nr:DUF4097 domain-containing protein [Turicibacter sp.]